MQDDEAGSGRPRTAWGFGLATVHESGAVLDTWYPDPHLGTVSDSPPPAELAALTGKDDRRGVHLEVRHTVIDLDAAPQDVPDAYLRPRSVRGRRFRDDPSAVAHQRSRHCLRR
jgi:hypothetical protein